MSAAEVLAPTRRCTSCAHEKPLCPPFYKRSGKGLDGYHQTCTDCLEDRKALRACQCCGVNNGHVFREDLSCDCGTTWEQSVQSSRTCTAR